MNSYRYDIGAIQFDVIIVGAGINGSAIARETLGWSAERAAAEADAYIAAAARYLDPAAASAR